MKRHLFGAAAAASTTTFLVTSNNFLRQGDNVSRNMSTSTQREKCMRIVSSLNTSAKFQSFVVKTIFTAYYVRTRLRIVPSPE